MNTWCTRIRKRGSLLRQLQGPREWWLFVRVLSFAALVPALFRLRLSLLRRVLEPGAGSRGAIPPDPARTRQILKCAEIARAVAHPLVSPKCLTRAVTLYYFLRRNGLAVSLCFGAARPDGRLVALPGHCWLEKDGAPFLESSDPRARFFPLYRLPVPAAAQGEKLPGVSGNAPRPLRLAHWSHFVLHFVSHFVSRLLGTERLAAKVEDKVGDKVCGVSQT